MRLRELAAARVRYGYRRLHVLLRREGWLVNAERIYRLYRDEGGFRSGRGRRSARAPGRYRSGRPTFGAPSNCWAMGFMSDRLLDGRPFRIPTVMGCAIAEGRSRSCPG